MTLRVGASREWLVYGPASATAYPIAVRMLADARERYRATTIPIIRTGRAEYPGAAWWDLDANLAAAYQEAETIHRNIRVAVYRMIWEAAVLDTEVYGMAWDTGNPAPFEPADSPRSAYVRIVGLAA